MRLDSDPEANLARWEALPDIADFQFLAEIKPGAVTLLEAEVRGTAQPLLVHQRSGWVMRTSWQPAARALADADAVGRPEPRDILAPDSRGPCFGDIPSGGAFGGASVLRGRE